MIKSQIACFLYLNFSDRNNNPRYCHRVVYSTSWEHCVPCWHVSWGGTSLEYTWSVLYSIRFALWVWGKHSCFHGSILSLLLWFGKNSIRGRCFCLCFSFLPQVPQQQSSKGEGRLDITQNYQHLQWDNSV